MSDHHHHPAPASRGSSDIRRLRAALFITVVFMAVEIAGGLASRSLSLLADAGHMLSDAAALGLGWFAAWLGGRPRTFEKTFGWRRFEIFAAFLNGAALWAIAALVGWQAYRRLLAPVRPSGAVMLAVAGAGLAANLVSAAILRGGRRGSLNVKGAYLHVLGDALGSGAVLASAAIIQTTGWTPADPLAAILVALLIGVSAGRLVRESFHILMEGAPAGLKPAEVLAAVSRLEGVASVHDFHLWTVSSGWISMSAHLQKCPEADPDKILARARALLKEGFGIDHATLQIESADGSACPTGCCEED